MNHSVPDFKMDDDDFAMIPASSSFSPPPSTFSRHKKPAMQDEDEIMELLWQNGQVLTQSQSQMSLKKSAAPPSYKYHDAVLPAEQATPSRDLRLSSTSQLHHHHQQQQNLFIQEDEMASWLHYPLHDTVTFVDEDHDFCSDLLYPPSSSSSVSVRAPSTTCVSTPPIRTIMNPETLQQLPATAISSAAATIPPIPPSRKAEVVQNFAHFSWQRASTVVRESKAVDSSDETPSASAVRSTVIVSSAVAGSSSGAANTNRETGTAMTTLEMAVSSSSSPRGSTVSGEAYQIQRPPPSTTRPPAEDRKRKGREGERETDCQGEVSDLISFKSKL